MTGRLAHDEVHTDTAQLTDGVIRLPAAVPFMDESADMLHWSDDGKLALLVGNSFYCQHCFS